MRVAKLVGASLASWAAVAVWLDRQAAVATLFGMLGPLFMVVGSWIVTERTYRRNRERVTAVMVGAFGVKMLFVAAYVVIMLRALSLEPLPFVASFTSYFIGLYGIEALLLKRLFAGGLDGPC